MKHLSIPLLLALLLTAGSCQSSQQINGFFMGSSLGGVFGSSIGGLMDGPRGADAGRALGMIIGGATGVAVTTPRSEKSRNDNRTTDSYNRRSPQAPAQPTIPQKFYDLKINNLRLTDSNNNHAIDANERAQLIFEIENIGRTTYYNITPVVEVSDPKRILISPPAIIASLSPGRSVRYTVDLFGKKNIKTGIAQFSISFAEGDLFYTVRRFDLSTRGRSK